jgi:hypothetical protein
MSPKGFESNASPLSALEELTEDGAGGLQTGDEDGGGDGRFSQDADGDGDRAAKDAAARRASDA